ncbi:MAG: D-alanyl-D-alanine carboxypeptidase [Saprospiraceae bacterium]|jgi:D-alanyl-D-alanine carboxypeptidase
MKISILYLSLFSFLLSSCSRELMIPVANCETQIENINPNHPQAADFQALLDKYVAKGFPGITMVVQTPENGKWIGSAGVSRIETQEPMKNCNVYHSASVAKTYHAVAAMTLVEEGKLDLDKTIDTYLPAWICDDLANKNTATVRQLMNHTSGIPDFIEDIDHILDYFNDLMHTFTTEKYLDYVCGDKALFAPGEKITYSNTNTVLLALIMDEIAGSHADIISERIINKLGLKQTFYKNEKGYPAPVGAVNTYVDFKEDGRMINSTKIERNFASMSIGHDGMLASAHDYFLFLQALFSGKLVSESSLEQMTDVISYPASLITGEGLGLEITKTALNDLTRIGHNGGSLGASNNVFYYVEKDTYIVICSNFGDFLNGPLTEFTWSALIGNRKTLQGEVELLLFGK